MENPCGGSRMWPWRSQWAWKTSMEGAGCGHGDPLQREQDMATGILHRGSRIWPQGSAVGAAGFSAAGTCSPLGRARAMPQHRGLPGWGSRGATLCTSPPRRQRQGTAVAGDRDGRWPKPPFLVAPSPTLARGGPRLWPGNGSREQRRLVAGAGSLPFLQEGPGAGQGARVLGCGDPARPRQIRPPASTCRQPVGAGEGVARVAELQPVPCCRHCQLQSPGHTSPCCGLISVSPWSRHLHKGAQCWLRVAIVVAGSQGWPCRGTLGSLL